MMFPSPLGRFAPATEGSRPPSRSQTDDGTMANDAFMKPEIPESLRDLMKMSIEQAKRAFDTFATTSEKTWRSLETTSQSARSGLMTLNTKIADITRSDAPSHSSGTSSYQSPSGYTPSRGY